MSTTEIRNFKPKFLKESALGKLTLPQVRGIPSGLPPLAKGEFEIARIALRSVLGDSIFLIARPSKDELHFRFIDEYETNFSGYTKTLKSIPNQGEIFDLFITFSVDGETPYLKSIIDSNNHDNYQEIIDFIVFDSAFYSGLNFLFGEYLKENYNSDSSFLKNDK